MVLEQLGLIFVSQKIQIGCSTHEIEKYMIKSKKSDFSLEPEKLSLSNCGGRISLRKMARLNH